MSIGGKIDIKQQQNVKMVNNKISKDITEGPILKTILKLAWPIMLGNSMQVIYNLTDTFWLGKLGAHAVAAISMIFPIIFLLISIGAGITIAGTTLVAQYTGAGDEKSKNKVAGQILVSVVIISIILSILGFIFNDNILHILGTPTEVFQGASDYLSVFFGGLPFMFLFFIFSALLRGFGDTKTPMKMMIISVIINVVLDPLLIFGWSFFPRMGVPGAALATITSRGLAGLAGIYILFKGNKGIQITKENLKPDFKLIKKILSIGIPSAGEMSIVALGMTVMMGIVSNFGAMTLAAYGIGSRVLSLVMMPTRGIGRATTTMVGQNLGANKVNRAEKSAWLSTGVIFGVLLVLWLILIISPQFVFSIFNKNPEVIDIGSSFLKIAGFSFGFLGIRLVLAGAFKGAGNTITSMVLAIIALWGLRLPLVYYLALKVEWNAQGVWWGMAIANIIAAFISIYWFKKGTWKSKTIKNNQTHIPSDKQNIVSEN